MVVPRKLRTMTSYGGRAVPAILCALTFTGTTGRQCSTLTHESMRKSFKQKWWSLMRQLLYRYLL